jgi:16S rRNA (cytidine1402-2'-O)-methyltransferase
MPAVSDPGYRVVAAAAAAGIPVTVIPGPSAVTAALAVSGLPSNRWAFEGFLPRKAAERAARLESLAGETRTMVLMEAPHRLVPTLAALADAFGPARPAVLCRELTKTWEEVVRGDLAALRAWAGDGTAVRGEITLVVAGIARAAARATRDARTSANAGAMAAEEGEEDSEGGNGRDPRDGRDGPPGWAEARRRAREPAALAEAAARYVAGGMAPKDAQRRVAVEHGVGRRAVAAAIQAAEAGRIRSAGGQVTGR